MSTAPTATTAAMTAAETDRTLALRGTRFPDLRLRDHGDEPRDPVAPGTPYTVLYFFPGAYARRESYPPGWAGIPGATGCTRQSCAYRDRLAEFRAAGATVRGVSTQSPQEQREFGAKERLRFPLLSDADLVLAGALELPVFEVAGVRRLRRLTMVVDRDRTVREVIPASGDVEESVRAALAVVLSAPRRD